MTYISDLLTCMEMLMASCGWLLLKDRIQTSNPDESTVFNIAQLDALPIQTAELASATVADPVLSKVLKNVRRGWPERTPEVVRLYWQKRAELTIEGNCILWGVRVLIPAPLQERVVQELHQGHPGIVRMKSLAHSRVWWPGIDKDLEDCAKACRTCQAIRSAPPKAPLHPWEWPTAP